MGTVNPSPADDRVTAPPPPMTPREHWTLVTAALMLVLAPVLLLGWFLTLESATNRCTADPPGQMNQWTEVELDRSWWPLFITCVIDPGTSRERRVSVPWESRPDCPVTRQGCPG